MPEFVLIAAVIFLAALVRSTFGFGDALVAMPLLALFTDLTLGTPLVAIFAVVIATTLLVRLRRSVAFGSTWRLVLSSLAGIPLGLYFLKGGDDTLLKLILALGIMAFASYKLFKPQLWTLRSDRSAWIFGFVAGILGGAFNTNGPPVIIYASLRRWDKETFRATMQGYFLPTNLLILSGHIAGGLWSAPLLRLAAICLPLVVLAIFLGERINRRISPGRFDPAIHCFLLLAGLSLLVQSLIKLMA